MSRPQGLTILGRQSEGGLGVLSSPSGGLNVIVAPGLYVNHIGVRPGYPYGYAWWASSVDSQKVNILVLNGTGNAVSGIDWGAIGNDTGLGVWWKDSALLGPHLGQYRFIPEGGTGGGVGAWKYPSTQRLWDKNGTYFNLWAWDYWGFPTPESGVNDSWYDAGNLSSYSNTNAFLVNLTIPGFDPVVNANTSFLLTPWGCGREGCHSGHMGSNTTCTAEWCDVGGSTSGGCADCHGGQDIWFWGTKSRLVTPHEERNMRESLACTACHINQLHGVHNSTLLGGTVNERCMYCHGSLSFPGTFTAASAQINDTIGGYRPAYTSIRENSRTYLLNKSDSSGYTLTLDWTDPNADLDLYVFDFNGTYKADSATSSRPEVITSSSEIETPGIYIVKVFYYVSTPPNIPDSSPPIDFNLSTDRGYRIMEKPVIDQNGFSWNCTRCHPLSSAVIKDTGLTWENYRLNRSSYAHGDVDGDGAGDVECRFCHNSLHNIGVRPCQQCHSQPVPSHIIQEPEYGAMSTETCVGCHSFIHSDPRRVEATPDCTGCHGTDYPGASPIVPPQYQFNISAFKNGVHLNINATPPDTASNEDCWRCHYEQDMNRSHINHCWSCHNQSRIGNILNWHSGSNMSVNLINLIFGARINDLGIPLY